MTAVGASPHVPLVGTWELWPLGALRTAGMPVGWLDLLGGPADTDPPRTHELAAHPELVEAVAWQNPAIVTNWLGDFHQRALDAARSGEGDVALSRRGQREQLLATLAQRYCAKNETIGFFGPVAWVRFDPAVPGEAQSGDLRLRSRSVFVEGWVVAAIAAAVSADPELADHLPLRRHPLCAVQPDAIIPPRGARLPTSPARSAILQALGEPRTLTELIRLLPDVVPPGGGEVLAGLEADGLVLRGIAVPLGEHPEAWLRARLEALTPSPARDRWIDRLDRLDGAVAAAAAAAGAPLRVVSALAACGELVRELVGDTLVDRSGADHGRGVLYEDCRRDLDAVVGGGLLDALRAPLGLLLQSARWLVSEVAAEVVRELRDRHERLARTGAEVTLARLLLASADVLSGAPATAVHRVVADFQERWAEVLSCGTLADGVLHLRSADTGGLADALFPTPAQLPWQSARQHSPDLMLRTRADGPPQWVLGELHLALNTLENRPFVTQSDDRDALLAWTRHDFSGGRIVPVWPRSSREVTSRTYPPLGLDLPDHYDYWSYATDEGRTGGGRGRESTALVVRDDGAQLWVEPVGGAWSRRVEEFFGEFLTALVVDRFHVRPAAPTLPRLVLDDVVVERATWTVAVADLLAEAPTGPSPRDADALAAQLAALGCPRRTFVKLAGERKPFLVDSTSPLLLRALAQALRREHLHGAGSMARIVEMLPAPEELWVRSGDDAYTSELRVVVVDAAAAGAPVKLPREDDAR